LGALKRKNVLEHVNQWVEERLDLLDTVERRTGGLASAPAVPWVLCVPAADRADEVVAKLLASALLERGIGAAFMKPDALERLPFGEGVPRVDAVVVSALPPEAVAPARAVCRSVRGRAREIPLMVGLWDPENDLQKPRQRLAAAGAGHVVVTFAECVAALEALAPVPLVEHPPETPRSSALLQA